MAKVDTHIILLPGMDGTARLFDRFIAAAPPQLSLLPIALPAEASNYEELTDRVAAMLPAGRLVLIAESFSGPLAIALTERRAISGLILCNSFITAPRARAFRWGAVPAMFKSPPPLFLLRRYLLGNRADDAIVGAMASAVASVPPSILASRLRSVLALKDTGAFARCTVPTLYVRGTDDRLVPGSAWRKMSLMRSISVAHVAGPHLLLQANPHGAWEAIRPFIESLLTTDGDTDARSARL